MFKNTMKTFVLLGGLAALCVGIGSFWGPTGALIGLGLGLLMVGSSYWFSDKLALRSAKAQLVTEEQAPEFYGMVRSLADRAGLPMPRVALSPSPQPNAFATGRSPKHAVVCATQGLLQSMSYAEVEGVMAHELMHVKHRDILIGSVAAAISTAISFLAQWAMFSGMFGGDDEDRPNPVVLLAVAILAPLAAGLMQMAISRSREFEADRGAAELLGTGEPLASALERIEVLAKQSPMAVQPSQAYAWIHSPLSEAPKRRSGVDMARLFSTHPDTAERISRLRTMSFA